MSAAQIMGAPAPAPIISRQDLPGRWVFPPSVLGKIPTFDNVLPLWRAAVAHRMGAGNLKNYREVFDVHLIPFFGTLEGITTRRMKAYNVARLELVKKCTLKKERSALNSLLEWATEEEYLFDAPLMPKLPRGADGTPHPVRRRREATDLNPEQCEALIAVLPPYSSSKVRRKPIPIQDRFIVAYETALRPTAMNRLSCPEHYQPGGATLKITPEIDKAKFGRELPLSPRAQAALSRVCKKKGLIFGKGAGEREMDFRYWLKKAAAQVLTEDKAITFCGYDFRHAKITEWCETGNLPGVAWQAGHKLLTTTNKYAHPGFRQGKDMLEASLRRAAEKADKSGSVPAAVPAVVLVTDEVLVMHDNREQIQESARNRGRTCTSLSSLEPESVSVNDDPLLVLMSREAVEIMRLASTGSSVEYSRMLAFARAFLQLTNIGTLALAVLDGGPLALARCLALAQLIAREGEQTLLHREEGKP